eukprot:m.147203 g.147203  ORF g.147203 m.147203 type:complete len:128 (-) comp20561_c4_seq3:23-406(-)
MLSKEDESDAPILREDQDRINKFARTNMRAEQMREELKELSKQLEVLADVEAEMLMGEEEGARVMVGEVFVAVSQDDASAMVAAQTAELTAQQKDMQGQLEKMEAELQDLKAQLYAKFGKSINLESE